MTDDFVKHDHGKPELYLLPPRATVEIGKVLTFGAKKYSPNNWHHVGKAERIPRYGSALLRHVFAYLAGEKVDPETGLHHLAHAGCCLMFILDLDLQDDARPPSDLENPVAGRKFTLTAKDMYKIGIPAEPRSRTFEAIRVNGTWRAEPGDRDYEFSGQPSVWSRMTANGSYYDIPLGLTGLAL